jgi:hypothetical protein
VRRKRVWVQEAGARDEQQLERLVQNQLQLSIPSGLYRSLVDGVSGRVGRLRGYGNAIDPTVSATFIRAAIECVA